MTRGAELQANGRDLVEFWSFTAKKGLMNSNTAGSLRSASREVLTAVAEEGWEEVDLRTLDVEECLQRFERLRTGKFKPNSLSVYKSRFKNAVALYLAYLDDPSGWRYTAERPAKDRKRPIAQRSEARVDDRPKKLGGGGEVMPSAPGVTMIPYPFPLRPGLVVTLNLPDDLTSREADRLGNHLKSLAIETPRGELMPAPSAAAAIERAS